MKFNFAAISPDQVVGELDGSATHAAYNAPSFEEDWTWGEAILDVPKAAGRGVIGMGEDIYGLLDDVADLGGIDLGAEGSDWRGNVFGETRTPVGAILEPIAEFATGFVPAAGLLGKFGKLAKLRQSGVMGSMAFGTIAGMPVDAIMGNSGAGLTRAFVEQFPELNNPLLDWLAGDEDDGAFETRLKAVLEGAALGGVVDGLWTLLRSAKATMKGEDGLAPLLNNKEALEKLADEIERPMTYEHLANRLRDAGRSEEEVSAAVGIVKANLSAVTKNHEKALSVLLEDIEVGAEANRIVTNEADGRAIIGLLENSSSADFINQWSRVFRSNLSRLDNNLAAKLDEIYGSKDGTWTQTQEDGFASDFEAYLSKGTAPNPETAPHFKRFRDWMKSMYTHVINSPLDRYLTEDQRKWFDEAFGGRERLPKRVRFSERAMAQFKLDMDGWIKGEVDPEVALRSLHQDASATFNLSKIVSDNDGLAALNLVSEALAPQIEKLTGGVQSFKQIKSEALDKLADETGAKPLLLRKRLAQNAANAAQIASDQFAGMIVLKSIADRVGVLAKMNVNDGLTTRQAAEYVKLIGEMGELSGMLKAVQTGSARTMAVGRMLKDINLPLDELDRQLALAGGADRLKRFSQKVVGITDAKTMRKIVDTSWSGRGRRLYDGALEYWINAILSGPVTHAVNALSNTVHGVMYPLEMMAGAAVSGDLKTMREATDNIIGMSMAFKEAAQMAVRAAVTGQSILDPTNFKVDLPAGAIGNSRSTTDLRDLMKFRERPAAQTALDLVGNFIRLPSRALAAEDEFAKQMLYRGHLYAKFAKEARLRKMDRRQAGQYIKDRMEAAFESGTGHATDREGLEWAREITFSQDLDKGLGKTLQNAAAKHPFLRIFLPFIRTPVNITRQMGQRLPGVNLFMKQFRDELTSPDPARRALARGKMGTGIVLSAAVASLAAEGRITGGGPSDYRLLNDLRATGWQPYSIVIEDENGNKKYISYRRVDPFASILGIVADFADLSGTAGDRDAEDIVSAVFASISRNFTSKTYLQGLADFVSVANGDERAALSWTRRFASSLVVPNFLNQINDDPYLREAESVVDAIKRRTPGYSDTLAPVRNALGQPVKLPAGIGPDMISPLAATDRPGNVALEELANLQYGFKHPQPEMFGVDMRTYKGENGQDAYDRWLELTGTAKLGGKTLEEALTKAIQSPAYQQMPTPAETGDDFESARLKVVRRIVSAYRKRARHQMLAEHPELSQALRTAAINARRVSVLGKMAQQQQ